MIHQGEQYSIPFKLKCGDTIITPSNCTDVRIQLGEILKEYSAEEITYNSAKKTWCYPVTESETRNLKNTALFEISVKFADGSIVKSKINKMMVYRSIIKEDWTDGST